MHLIENGISEQTANRIQTLLDKDGAFDEVIAHLKGFTKSKTEVIIHEFQFYKFICSCFILNLGI